MSTETQINANRLNAQRSTGPRTPEGKAKVSQNAVTHGLTALRPVLANENPEEYTLFRDDFFRHYAPVGILEETLAQRAADSFWRLQRAQDYETAVLNTLITEARSKTQTEARIETLTKARSASDGISSDASNDLLGQVLLDDFRQTHCLEKVQKYEMAIERSFFRTLKELRRLQSHRLKVGEASVLHSNSANSKVGEASVLHSNSANSKVGEASVLHCDSVNSKTEQNKANLLDITPKSKIENLSPTDQISSIIDPINLLENCIRNPIDLDPLTKIMMKKDNFRPSAKKVG
jgi:hypothetical protein